jgi:hypothetical protein
MEEFEALAEVFLPDEQVTITLNDEVLYSGPFEAALPVLTGLDLQPEDHLMVTNEEVGPLAADPDYFCYN